MGIPIEIAKNEIQSLVNLVKNEAQYLCCFNSYVQEYDQEKDMLNAKLQDVNRIIDKDKGVSNVTSVALQWKRKAEELIAVDADTKKEKCFNDLCLNCWRQYRKGRDLAKQTLDIKRLLERCNFDIVAGSTNLLGIKYRCLPNFMPFESRKSALQDLKKALEDEESNMIGLYGLGGTGKTSMATQVGAELEGSTFAKVIFLVVSKPPDFKKLRGEIATHLDVKLEKGEEEACQDKILTKINLLKEKLLIVLDDVWEQFDLTKELGIPPLHLHKGCIVLITTRNKDICTKMDCQRNIHLDALSPEEALSLFLKHTNNSSNLESLVPKIVKHCHGVPVVIVAVARSLKDRPLKVWMEALRNLESGKSILEVREDLKKVYEGLKLSYDNLKNEKAKKLFLISSLFPEDFEIPVEFLIRIGVGMGPFGEVDDYNERRRKVFDAIEELLDSSLLLNAERECVKMHDLVHEVALLIGGKDIQSIIESKQLVKKGLQCLFWENDDFPKHFDGGNLEILIILLHGLENLKVPDTFFIEMTKLKVLFLWNEHYVRIPAPSLFPSIQSLQDIRTLMVVNLELCSISMLGKLPNLETLWLEDCSIIKLPGENFELKKLRCLRIEDCIIKMSNPFELIKACPLLEELTFLSNKHDVEEKEDTISQKVYFHTLQIYQISSSDLSDYFEKYGSLSRCFVPGTLMQLISEATFKQLTRTAELLSLEGYGETKHKNLIPDIVPVDDGGTTDLIVLKLDFCPDMQCLIDSTNNRIDVKAFSNLVELYLDEMGLSNILFNGNYNLCHLKTMTLLHCPKLTSIFLPSTAQGLSQLEKLTIWACDALECIIEDKSSREEIAGGGDGENDQKSYTTLFPKLKILQIRRCGNLEIILPIFPHGGLLERVTVGMCMKLKYIFDKFQEVNVMLPSNMEMDLCLLPSLVGIFREYKTSFSSPLQHPVSTASGDNLKMIVPSSKRQHGICWGKVCCFKTKATSESEESNDAVPTGTLLDQGIPQELDASTYGVSPFDVVQSLLVQSLKNVRKIKLMECGNLISLSTLSIAASTISLENLTIHKCHKLKCITTHEGDAQVDKNYCSIFPRLEELEIEDCKELEFLFLSTISCGLEKLNSLTINRVLKLKYVVGKYQQQQHSSNQNQNDDQLHFDLPTLETLIIKGAPKINSICAKNYNPVLSSLKSFYAVNCGMKSFTDYNMVNLRTTQELDASTYGVSPFNVVQSLLVQSLKNVREIELVTCWNLTSLSTLFITASTISLENLTIRECHKLMCITTHDEGDAQVDKNYCSIFTRLKKLQIKNCDGLEFLFLSTISCGLEKLKSLTINGVPKLKYVVGKYQQEEHSFNQNQNDNQLHFNLPALETLNIEDAPTINDICAKNYNLMLSSLKYFYVGNCGIKSSTDHNMVNLRTTQVIEMCWQTLESLLVRNFKIEEIFNLTHMDVEKNGDGCEPLTSRLQKLVLQDLSELVNICLGPKCIMCFHNLQKLKITACKKLKVIFSASIVPSLPMLKELNISKCEELVHIVGEDYETNVGAHLMSHKPCFPNLKQVFIEESDKLKYLFSISINDILPKLRYLMIRQAYELEHVLIKRGMMKEMAMKDVLPQLSHLKLKELPNLVSVCHGIDFQILKDSPWTDVQDCSHFSFYETSSTQHQIVCETADSEVEEEVEEELSSHLSTEQSLNMGEATQQSLTKDELTSKKVKNEAIKMDSTAIGTENSIKKVPIHTSPNLFVLPSRDNTYAKIFEDEEEEEEQGGLITSRHPRSGMKASSSLSKEKLHTSIEKTTTTPDGSKNQDFVVWKGTEQKLSSYLNGRQTLETQQSTIGSSNFTTDDKEVNPSDVINRTDSQKDELVGKVARNERNMIDPQQSTMGARNFTKDELVNKEVKKETNTMESKSQEEMARHDIQSHEKEEEKKEGDPNVPYTTPILSKQTSEAMWPLSPISSKVSTGLDQTPLATLYKPIDDDIQVSDKSHATVIGNVIPILQPTTLCKGVNDKDIKQTNASQDESKANLGEHVSVPSNIRQMEQDSSFSRGQIEHHDVIKSDINQALNIGVVKEIVHMMKLEGSESCLLEEALKTHPQLRLSTNDRSTQMLCISYRVLIDILNILTARTPFTITEGDKRLLEEKLKDACLLGFDKDWLESIKTRVFNCDVREVDGIQESLKGLDSDLKTNEAMRAATRNQEIEAARVVESAQKDLDAALQEHANVMANHTQLLKAHQHILVRQNQCWEMIAFKNKPFGF